MPSLELEVKQLIIESLRLEDMTPEQIDSDAPLFVEGLGLDSIDALELGIAIRKKYNIHLSGDPTETRAQFASVRSLMTLISAQPRIGSPQ